MTLRSASQITDTAEVPEVVLPPLDTPLVLDLDNTLIRSDLLAEGAFAILRRSPLQIVPMIGALLKGRAHLKQWVAVRAGLDVNLLPQNDALVAHALAEKAKGRRIVLATAADALTARQIAARFPFIDDVISSDGHTNLKGEIKARRLREAFPQGFDYAGDAAADLPVWHAATEVLTVGASRRTRVAVAALGKPTLDFPAPSPVKSFVKALRLHQWAKNALVFFPLIPGGRAHEPWAWAAAAAAFLACGLIASGGYLFNDLLDLQHDRAHRSKRNRPLASGRLSLLAGGLTMVVALACGFAIAAGLGIGAVAFLGLYLGLTVSYSMALKRVPILDAATLGTLFSLRLALGVVVTHVAWSAWLLTFSMFLFTALSFAKRQVEIRSAARAGREGMIAGRGYQPADEPIVIAFGVASGIASVVILILYLTNEAFRAASLTAPLALWAFPPVLTLWMGRIWILCAREQLNDDPVAFAVRDRVSLVLGAIVAVAFVVAAVGVPHGVLA